MPIDKKKVLYEIRVFVLMILIVSSLRSALADWNDVPTGSMKPTIQEGDRVVVNKLAYDLKIPFTTINIFKWGDPQRGDIVVLFSPKDGTRLVKRVVAIPGDEVEMRDNQLFINGKLAQQSPITTVGADEYGLAYVLDEDLAGHRHKIMISETMGGAERTFGPLKIQDNHYFVLGDNRDNSNDSRYIGMIERRRIVGEAVAVAFSFERWYKPRFERFFEGLE